MGFMEITDRPAVRYEIAVKAPLLQFAHKECTGAGGFPVQAGIGAHDAFDFRFFNERFESRQIGLGKVLL